MKEYKDYAKITAHFDLAIEEAIKFGGDVGRHAVLLFETMRKELDTVPTADVVEVKHGRWEERPVNVGTPTTDLFCSECNFVSFHWRYNYCPDCGAKMDKGE